MEKEGKRDREKGKGARGECTIRPNMISQAQFQVCLSALWSPIAASSAVGREVTLIS